MIWAIVYFALVVFDCYSSKTQIDYYGVDYEANPVIRKLAKHAGIRSAVLAGIVFPATAIYGLTVLLHAPSILHFICGMRAMLAISQVGWLTR